MPPFDARTLLLAAAEHAASALESLWDGPVARPVDPSALRDRFGTGPLPQEGLAASLVLDELVAAAEPGLVATPGPRFFGFVIGGSVPAALSADVLTAAWDQVAFSRATSPAAAAAEEVVGRWLIDLFGLPAGASFGLVTGGQAANNVGLAAARHEVLRRAGWDVEVDGLVGAPAIRVLASEERHATVDRALRLLGLGTSCIVAVAADANGALSAPSLRAALAEGEGPTIVCAQLGNVNTGACDDLTAVCAAARDAGAWVHVDGAFGLWAAASPSTRARTAGVELADSWATDGHKWLNVPYDSGFVFCAHPDAHRRSMAFRAAYLVGHDDEGPRSPADYVPESSRRARGFAAWAALRSLGRSGVADLVERCCALARRFAAALSAEDGVTVENEVVLNQVLVRFVDDATTDAVVAGVVADGTCWVGGTEWRGRRYMRISVSNWSTTPEDVDRSVEAMLRVFGAVRS